MVPGRKSIVRGTGRELSAIQRKTLPLGDLEVSLRTSCGLASELPNFCAAKGAHSCFREGSTNIITT